MTVLTLVAVLQMNMKTSKTSLEEATLIETALTTCFGYWAAFSFVIYAAVYICSSYINTIQVRQNILTGFGPWIPESYHIFRLYRWLVTAFAVTCWSHSSPNSSIMVVVPLCFFGLLFVEHLHSESVLF